MHYIGATFPNNCLSIDIIGLIVALYWCDLPQQHLFIKVNDLIGLIVALYWCDLPQQLSFNLSDLIGLIVALYWCDLPQQQLFVNINHLIGLIVALYRCDLPQELFIRINHFDGLTLRYPCNSPSQPSTCRVDCCIIGATFKDQL